MQRAPAEALQPLPGAPTASLGALLRTLEAFPGPLGSGTKPDKVGGWVGAAESAARSTAGQQRDGMLPVAVS